jgi:broad specificity phosphatase PhoE
MTTFLLVRHGETDAVGRFLTGWKTGCHLNDRGKLQVSRLAQSLLGLAMQAIYTSPLERAVETAEILGKPQGLSPVIRDDLGELRFGEWEGKTFEELSQDRMWASFNTTRSLVRAPGGELMIETQTRMIREIESLRDRHQNETVAVVSHLDPLRSLLAHCLGMPLDLLLRFEMNPGSVSLLRYFEDQPVVLCMNHMGELPV